MSQKPSLKVFRYACGDHQKIGYAVSRAAFLRMTGVDASYVSETGNKDDIAMAEQAGEGFFMSRTGREGWVRLQSKETIGQSLLDRIKLMVSGTGNAPAMRIERGETVKDGYSTTVNRDVIIDGEKRGYWSRSGSRWTLRDTTGHVAECATHYHAYEGEMRETNFGKPYAVTLRGWDEAEALRSVLQAWEDDQLPPVSEQRIRHAKRTNAANQKLARSRALARLLPHYEALEQVLQQAREAGITDADSILDIMNQQDDQ